MMDEYQDPIEALRDMDFHVWKPPERPNRPLRHGVYCITRLEPKADTSLSNQPQHPPPVVRLCSPWEASALLETPRQSSHPPTIHKDAALGYPAMGYQSEETGFGHADGEKQVLLFSESNCRKERRAPEASSLTQHGSPFPTQLRHVLE